jgi:hypothetical protein
VRVSYMRLVVLKLVGLLIASALSAGCYTYSTIDLASAAPGMEVRARVSAATAAQLAPSLGMSDARLLSGPVVQRDADGLTIRVPTAPIGTIGAQEGLFQQILVNRSDLLELESRQLDRTRTGVMIGAAFVGATVIAVTALHGRSSGANATTEPPSNFNRRARGVQLTFVAPIRGVLGGARRQN